MRAAPVAQHGERVVGRSPGRPGAGEPAAAAAGLDPAGELTIDISA